MATLKRNCHTEKNKLYISQKMDDVASARSENANLRKIQQKLLQWDNKDKPLAPLSTSQLDAIENLTLLCTGSNADVSVFTCHTSVNSSRLDAPNFHRLC